jgi:inosose dehydratase
MNNLEFSYQTNMWGVLKYAKMSDYYEWYAKDYGNSVYYMDWDKVIKYIVAAGFKGIEVMVFDLPMIQNIFGTLTNFSNFAKERGIERITGMFSHHIGSEDKKNWPEIFDYQKRAIDALYELGGKNLIVQPAGQYYGLGPLSKDQLKTAAECMNEVGKMAADKGLEICIHNEFWCAVNKYDHERFIEMTDPKYVAYCLDTAQVSIMGVDVVKFYDKYHDRMKYLHLKDTTYANAPDEKRFEAGAEFNDEGTRWFWELGAGTVDFKGLWKLLKKHGHKGWVTLETEGTPDPLVTMMLSKWYIDRELLPIYK